MARERPSRRLRPGVVGYQGIRLSLASPHRRLEVPSGTVTLWLGFEHHLWITDLTAPPDASPQPRPAARGGALRGARPEARPQGRRMSQERTPAGQSSGRLATPLSPLSPQSHTSLLSPLRSRASIGEHSGRLYGMEIVLAPWAAYRLFGVTMHE